MLKYNYHVLNSTYLGKLGNTTLYVAHMHSFHLVYRQWILGMTANAIIKETQNV